MKSFWENHRVLVTALTVTLSGLGGCVEYTIETIVNVDGSGVRREEMIVDESEGTYAEVSNVEFGELMFVSESERWTHREEVRDGDTVHVFRRETRVADLDGWGAISDDVRIAGATRAGAHSSVGRISLGDVQFRNAVRVETSQAAELTTFTYRESFYWENLATAVVEFFVQVFAEKIDARYADLSSGERGEIVGLVRGGLLSAVDQGLLDADSGEEERLYSAFVDRTAPQAARVARQSYPAVDEERFRELLREVYDDDEQFEELLGQKLPGLELAINTAIIFRLNMPGRVTNSNAHDRDGDTLVWEFGPGDAGSAPVEIFAQSVVRR